MDKSLLFLAAFLAPAAVIVLYNAAIAVLLRRHARAKRCDPATGVMKGAEPVVLTRADAKKAALLLHGFIGSPAEYGRLPRLLHEKGYDVHAPLLPGHGTDPKDFSKTTADELQEFARKRYAVLKARYDEVALIGFSLGGALAVLTAASENVDRLVLLAPYFKIRHQWYYGLPTEAYHRMFRVAIPYVYRPAAFKQIRNKAAMDSIIDYDCVSLAGASAAMEAGRRAARRIHEMRQPTLVLHSRHDCATDYAASVKAVERLKGVARLVTLENSNHILLWDHDAEAVEKAVLDFVAGGAPV